MLLKEIKCSEVTEESLLQYFAAETAKVQY